MPSYMIGDEHTAPEKEGYADLLENAYRERVRPLCMCVEPGVPMYIARFNDELIVKRMPDTGAKHAAHCDSFESPADLSGFGEVEGAAIQHEEDGTVSLKFAFSLSRNGTVEAPKELLEHTSATASGSRLTLRGLLHYLWKEGDLCRWIPAFEGKRNWKQVRDRLLEAQSSKHAKRMELTDILYIPEKFIGRYADDIAARRMSKMSTIMGPGIAGKKMMVLVGEFDYVADSRFGKSLHIKEMPDFPFLMNADLYKAFDKLFGGVLSLQAIVVGGHLMTIFTFVIDSNGVPIIQEIAIMMTTAQWIPIENTHDNDLVKKLVAEFRSFHKQLRVNSPSNKAIVSALLTDVAGPPVGLYLDLGNIVSNWATSDSIKWLIDSSQIPHWIYDPRTKIQPLPPKAYRQFPSNTIHDHSASVAESPKHRPGESEHA